MNLAVSLSRCYCIRRQSCNLTNCCTSCISLRYSSHCNFRVKKKKGKNKKHGQMALLLRGTEKWRELCNSLWMLPCLFDFCLHCGKDNVFQEGFIYIVHAAQLNIDNQLQGSICSRSSSSGLHHLFLPRLRQCIIQGQLFLLPVWLREQFFVLDFLSFLFWLFFPTLISCNCEPHDDHWVISPSVLSEVSVQSYDCIVALIWVIFYKSHRVDIRLWEVAVQCQLFNIVL